MKISIDVVNYIAKLAKLKLDENEIEKLQVEFETILNQFNSLSKLELETNELSIDEDDCRASIAPDVAEVSDSERIMSSSKSYKDGYIEVPKVIE